MTLAPRVEVYTQLSCRDVYGHRPTLANATSQMHIAPPHVTLGTLNAPLHTPASVNTPTLGPTPSVDYQERDGRETDNPLHVSSAQCTSDPEVQSATARLQMLMTTIMGVLSALSTGWWGHFSERYGRTRVLALSTFAIFLTYVVYSLFSALDDVQPLYYFSSTGTLCLSWFLYHHRRSLDMATSFSSWHL